MRQADAVLSAWAGRRIVDVMRAWVVDQPGPIATGPLRAVERPEPQPGPGEVRVRVAACGVCRTDLHLAEGDLPPRRSGTVPGHEVVGVGRRARPGRDPVRARRPDRHRLAARHLRPLPVVPQRAGRTCARTPRFTGWDADGGYAEYAVVPEAFAYRLPEALDDGEAAPLLCAGHHRLPRAAARPSCRRAAGSGIYGFGASAHVVAQVALAQGAAVHVLTRSAQARELALELGAASAGPADAAPPEPLDAAILFAPAGELVPVALRALDRGGTLAVAGIHLSDIPALDYDRRAVPGAAAAQRHRQHPGRRRGVPPAGRRARASGRRSTARPLGRGGPRPSPTWPRTGSPAPRS